MFLQANEINDKIKALADEMQYYRAISINSKHKNDQILDLHGLKISGAMRVLKEFLWVYFYTMAYNILTM